MSANYRPPRVDFDPVLGTFRRQDDPPKVKPPPVDTVRRLLLESLSSTDASTPRALNVPRHLQSILMPHE